MICTFIGGPWDGAQVVDIDESEDRISLTADGAPNVKPGDLARIHTYIRTGPDTFEYKNVEHMTVVADDH